MLKEEKNKILRESISATRSKRALQTCKSFKFKIDKSSLSKEQKESIKMFFVEAKRTYNYILNDINNGEDLFKYDYKKLNHITYYDKDRNLIEYDNKYIKTSVIQEIIAGMKYSIKGLSASKKNGNKVGALRFKSECNSISLKQYGTTHYIRGNKFKIQGIKKPIRVNGLKQLEQYDNIDYTVANLLYDGYDYFISLTCYIDKEIKIKNDNIIGIDLGCESTVTTSDGEKMKVSIEESKRLKGLQAKLAKQTKRSNNWYKTKSKIRKEYNKMTNKKEDVANKIVNKLSYNKLIIMQDDQINEWHENERLSKTIQRSVIGRVKSKLQKKDNVIILDQWFPTSKYCFECGCKTDLALSDRTFICSECGCETDRDAHAAKNMIDFYIKIKSAGTVDLKPGRKVVYNKYKHLFEQEAQSSLAVE